MAKARLLLFDKHTERAALFLFLIELSDLNLEFYGQVLLDTFTLLPKLPLELRTTTWNPNFARNRKHRINHRMAIDYKQRNKISDQRANPCNFSKLDIPPASAVIADLHSTTASQIPGSLLSNLRPT